MQENGEGGCYRSVQQLVFVQGSFILAGKISTQVTIMEGLLWEDRNTVQNHFWEGKVTSHSGYWDSLHRGSYTEVGLEDVNRAREKAIWHTQNRRRRAASWVAQLDWSTAYVESWLMTLERAVGAKPRGKLEYQAEKSGFHWWAVENHWRIFLHNFIEGVLTCDKLHISKYSLISWGMCIYPQNHHHNQDNEQGQSLSEVPLKDIKRMTIKAKLWENISWVLKNKRSLLIKLLKVSWSPSVVCQISKWIITSKNE